MKILLTGNCQVDGLHVFLSRALPKFEFRRLPHLATFYQEFPEEKIAEDHAWADLVFFHHKHDHPQDYPTKQPKIPLSVWFQSAPFMAQVPGHIWERLRKEEYDVETIVRDADLDYESRWDECYRRMVEKEINEGVPELMRMSSLMLYGRIEQQQLTCNHPTSVVFWEWTIRIMGFLNKRSSSAYSIEECRGTPNLAGLPCEESATSGAVKHLGLKWGGRPEDDESGRGIARKQLGL